MTLSSEVVNLVGLNLRHQTAQIRGVRQISVVEEEVDSLTVRILVKVVNATSVEGRGTSNDSVHLVSLDHDGFAIKTHFREKKFGKIRTILTSNSGNKCDLFLCGLDLLRGGHELVETDGKEQKSGECGNEDLKLPNLHVSTNAS